MLVSSSDHMYVCLVRLASQVKATIRAYWILYLWVIAVVSLVIGLYFAPPPYRIRNIPTTLPLLWNAFFHMFMPVFLNPVLMLFKF